MRIVYMPGVWDLLHVGHVAALESARALGDVLVVGVPGDEVVREDKGSLPVIPLHARLRMLLALRCVDVAYPYHALEFVTHLALFRPDVLAVGETWGCEQRHLDAEQWARDHGCRVVKLPYTPEESTTSIRQRILRDG